MTPLSPDEQRMLRESSSQEWLVGLDRGTLSESLAMDMLRFHGVEIEAKLMPHGWTALHLAAGRSMKRLVDALLQAGASPSMTSSSGVTALGALALMSAEATEITPGMRWIVRRLLAAGAHPREVPLRLRSSPIGQEIRSMGTRPPESWRSNDR